MSSVRGGVLLTGASGYLGSLAAAALLAEEPVELVAPVRARYDREGVLGPIRAELEAGGHALGPDQAARLHCVPLPAFDDLGALDQVVREWGVDEVVHCAGCVDYFDTRTLEAVNVGFTRELLKRARHWGLRRFVYVSTAFSSGYVDGRVAERLHPEPACDPTEYTRTKRAAEWLVAESGLPFLILRPSIVIGDSRDGHYSGKPYGVYQLWSGIARLLCSEWQPEFHVPASRQPVTLVHQDAFQRAFLAARRWLPDDSIANLVSARETSPDMRQLWDLWIRACFRPRVAYYYEKLADVPLRRIHTRQRALLALASVNIEIASHPWRFETAHLDRLRARGLRFADATLESVAACQRLFIEESPKLQEFLAAHHGQFAKETGIIDVPAGPAPAPARAAARASAAPAD